MNAVGCVGGLTLDWVKRAQVTSGPSVGGNALYSGVGAWLARATPAVCAVVGSDFPHAALQGLEEFGFDLSALRSVAGPSFHVLLDDSTERRSVSYLPDSGCNADLDPHESQIRSSWAAAHIGAIPTGSQLRLAERLESLLVPFTVDTIVIPGQIEPDRNSLEDVVRRSSAFLPSSQEVDALWPGRALQERVVRLAGELRTTVVATCGAQGSIGCDGSAVVRMPAFGVAVTDTTGAGDAYCGAFAAGSAAGADLRRAMAVAAAASSVVIGGYGAIHAVREDARREVDRRAQVLYEMSGRLTSHVVEC